MSKLHFTVIVLLAAAAVAAGQTSPNDYQAMMAAMESAEKLAVHTDSARQVRLEQPANIKNEGVLSWH